MWTKIKDFFSPQVEVKNPHPYQALLSERLDTAEAECEYLNHELLRADEEIKILQDQIDQLRAENDLLLELIQKRSSDQ